MKKLFFIFCFIFSTFFCGSQNLVPNPSFEVYDTCPNLDGQINYAVPWFTANIGSPDYFNQCGIIGYTSVPSNWLGTQNAKTGVAYSGIFVYGGSNLRPSMAVPLTDTLIAGSLYCVHFSVNLTILDSFNTQVAITEMGLLFSNNSIIASDALPLPYIPQITSPSGVYLSDTANWMDVSGIYTAVGGERFITIGNFKNDASTDTTILLNATVQQSYYYIDDVSVINCDSLAGIPDYKDISLFNLFPNPNNGNMTFAPA